MKFLKEASLTKLFWVYWVAIYYVSAAVFGIVYGIQVSGDISNNAMIGFLSVMTLYRFILMPYLWKAADAFTGHQAWAWVTKGIIIWFVVYTIGQVIFSII